MEGAKNECWGGATTTTGDLAGHRRHMISSSNLLALPLFRWCASGLIHVSVKSSSLVDSDAVDTADVTATVTCSMS